MASQLMRYAKARGQTPLETLGVLVGEGAIEEALVIAADQERREAVSALLQGVDHAEVATSRLLTLIAAEG